MIRRGPQLITEEEELGQATLEFALVVLIILLLMFAIVDFSRLFFAYATMANGVREGARYAIVHPPDDPDDLADANRLATISRTRAMMVLIGSDAEIEVEYPGRDNGSDPKCLAPHYCRVLVRATSDFDVWTPVLPSLQIVTQATMHFE